MTSHSKIAEFNRECVVPFIHKLRCSLHTRCRLCSHNKTWSDSGANWRDLQGEHKVFPWLQTFITGKLRGI